MTLDERLVRLSKALSRILRHQAEKYSINIQSNGFILLDDLLNLNIFSGFTKQEVYQVVHENDKKRFEIQVIDGKEYIRAVQGHTIKTIKDEELLTRITDPKEIKECIHGTYYHCWNSILSTGLSSMKRNHIHFSPGLPSSNEVISGMRKSAEIYIYIDINKCFQDHILFYKSKNNVILSRGINNSGVLPSKYFLKVIDKKTNKQIY